MTTETQTRNVLRVVEPIAVLEGAGVKLKRTIASRALDYLDPFLLLDHFGSDNPDDYLAGFPWHPHRGIETVTYMLAGEVDHRDSIGNAGTIGAGDVQWMTAGGGIMHEEMPRPREGKMAGFQLW
jgi:redox-sensitive bicupin YhaK (pirin superfamily)